jgi:hypothetical protein
VDEFGEEYGEELKFIVELMLKRESKDRPNWVDLEDYARKGEEKEQFGAHKNQQQLFSKNGSVALSSNTELLASLPADYPAPPHSARESNRMIYAPPSVPATVTYNPPNKPQWIPPPVSAGYSFQPTDLPVMNNMSSSSAGKAFRAPTFSNSYNPIASAAIQPLEPTPLAVSATAPYHDSSHATFGYRQPQRTAE